MAQAFAGRGVWLIGAAGGIGRATAIRLAQAGARLCLTDVRQAEAIELADRLSRVAATIVCAPADVASADELERAFGEAAGQLGGIDILIHAAGVVAPGGIEDCPPDVWRAALDVNLTSVYLAARLVLPGMLQRRRGKIVSCSSVNGRDGGSALSGIAYAVAKGGIITLTRHLAKAYAAHNIQVNCVAPGPVETGMLDRITPEERVAMLAAVPAGRSASPEEIAAAILYLAGPESDYVTGVALDINGGRFMS
ncbi:MAG: SDR family oxidoreductase [Chloroflexi bacterium]|nr:SDR family oxidoreductase [Chloroflexota bacterium]